MRIAIIWLDGSKRPPGSPIRRRWRIYAGRVCLLSVPISTVSWSR